MDNQFAWILLSIFVLVVWPASIVIRRWWYRPYRDTWRLYRQLARSLNLSRDEQRTLEVIVKSQHANLSGKDSTIVPHMAAVWLLDNDKWASSASEEKADALRSRLFTKS